MADNPMAMAELRSLLAARRTLYERADITVNTSRLAVEEAADRIATGVRA